MKVFPIIWFLMILKFFIKKCTQVHVVNKYMNCMQYIFNIVFSIFACFYYCKHFLLTYIIFLFIDIYFMWLKSHGMPLIYFFNKLWEDSSQHFIWWVSFQYWLLLKIEMNQHWSCAKSVFQFFEQWYCLSSHCKNYT